MVSFVTQQVDVFDQKNVVVEDLMVVDLLALANL
jgi:hypothetical protein